MLEEPVSPRAWSAAARALVALVALASPPLRAQTLDDALMMPRRTLCTGVTYADDRWDEYWEGTRKRDNGNIGTLTTRSVAWMGSYGVTDKLNVIAMLPFLWTRASQGPLSPMHGVQDLTFGVKYRALQAEAGAAGTLRAFVAAFAAVPASDYTPDFLPLSIGSASRRLGARLTLNFETRRGLFVHASLARTWRDNVRLERAAYFTDGRLVLSDEVAMPAVLDYSLGAGFRNARWHVPLTFTRQSTRGGGDIRRQDMPFVSDRMNFSKLEAAVMYTLPSPLRLGARLAGARILDGRNVGQSTIVTASLLYTFSF